MKVNLLIVATGKYIQFLPGLLESAEKHFLKGHDVHYCIFTDYLGGLLNAEIEGKATIYPIEHKPWPWATLKRFHFFQLYQEDLPKSDYFAYVDADALFKADVGDEILGERVAVQHCGYVQELPSALPYERRKESVCHVAPGEGERYFGGGFWLFSAAEFWPLVDWCTNAINTDEFNGIVPVWHDESCLNRYLISKPPTKVLSPSFHWPQDTPHVWGKWEALGLEFDCKILMLKKDHKEYQK